MQPVFQKWRHFDEGYPGTGANMRTITPPQSEATKRTSKSFNLGDNKCKRCLSHRTLNKGN